MEHGEGGAAIEREGGIKTGRVYRTFWVVRLWPWDSLVVSAGPDREGLY